MKIIVVKVFRMPGLFITLKTPGLNYRYNFEGAINGQWRYRIRGIFYTAFNLMMHKNSKIKKKNLFYFILFIFLCVCTRLIYNNPYT